MRSTFWWDVVEVIVYSQKVTAYGRQVVGLGRINQRAILIKTNAVRSKGIGDRLNGREREGESSQDGVNEVITNAHGRVCGGKVRAFKPDLGWPNENGQIYMRVAASCTRLT